MISLLMLLAAGAPMAAEETAIREGQRAECVAVEVTSPEGRLSRGRPDGKRVFSASAIRDLELSTRLRPRLPGEHVLRFKLYTPSGHLYQVMAVPFGPPAASASESPTQGIGAHARPEAAPEAVRYRRPKPLEVAARFPVRGTLVTTGSLFGRWRVEPYLDGQPSACGPSTSFRIQP